MATDAAVSKEGLFIPVSHSLLLVTLPLPRGTTRTSFTLWTCRALDKKEHKADIISSFSSAH